MESRSVGDAKVACIMQKLDSYNAKELEDQLKGLLTDGTQKLVCDFGQTEYISSAGLRVFLIMLKSLKGSGGRIVLCSLRPTVRSIFDLAGFSRIFEIFGSEEEALKALS